MKPTRQAFFGMAMAAAVCTPPLSTGALAQQEAEPAGTLSLELNKIEEGDNGCLFTFVADNGLDTSFETAAYEVVLFDAEGIVELMAVLDFQELPAAHTRVRQFNISETDCGAVSRVLVNGVSACDGTGVEPGTCMDRLTVTSRTDVEFSD